MKDESQFQCIILYEGELVRNRAGKKIMSCQDAKDEVQFGIGALYPTTKYKIYKISELKKENEPI